MAEQRKSNRSRNGNKKHGRNKDYCKSYAARHLQEKHKARRLRKHLEKFPNDAAAQAALAKVG